MTEPSDARSALDLRLVLAAFGLVSCAGLAVLSFAAAGVAALGIVLGALALVAAADLGVVAARRRGRPGEHSLFDQPRG